MKVGRDVQIMQWKYKKPTAYKSEFSNLQYKNDLCFTEHFDPSLYAILFFEFQKLN